MEYLPALLYTAAIYQLNRTNVPLAIGGGLFAISGSNVIKGFETALTGFVTNDWQATLGYAYTDARIGSDTNSSTAAVPPPPTILRATASSSCRSTRSRYGIGIRSIQCGAPDLASSILGFVCIVG